MQLQRDAEQLWARAEQSQESKKRQKTSILYKIYPNDDTMCKHSTHLSVRGFFISIGEVRCSVCLQLGANDLRSHPCRAAAQFYITPFLQSTVLTRLKGSFSVNSLIYLT